MRHHVRAGLAVVTDILGGKWTVVLLAHLKEQDLRYAQVRRRLLGISDKVWPTGCVAWWRSSTPEDAGHTVDPAGPRIDRLTVRRKRPSLVERHRVLETGERDALGGRAGPGDAQPRLTQFGNNRLTHGHRFRATLARHVAEPDEEHL